MTPLEGLFFSLIIVEHAKITQRGYVTSARTPRQGRWGLQGSLGLAAFRDGQMWEVRGRQVSKVPETLHLGTHLPAVAGSPEGPPSPTLLSSPDRL